MHFYVWKVFRCSEVWSSYRGKTMGTHFALLEINFYRISHSTEFSAWDWDPKILDYMWHQASDIGTHTTIHAPEKVISKEKQNYAFQTHRHTERKEYWAYPIWCVICLYICKSSTAEKCDFRKMMDIKMYMCFEGLEFQTIQTLWKRNRNRKKWRKEERKKNPNHTTHMPNAWKSCSRSSILEAKWKRRRMTQQCKEYKILCSYINRL